MTLVSDVIREVSRSFGDTDQVFCTNADYYDWINEAIKEICKNTQCLSKTITAAASTFPVALYSDFIAIEKVAYGAYVLTEVQLNDLDHVSADMTTTATPSYFYLDLRKINLFPLQPSGDTTSVVVTYYYFPTNVTVVGDTIATPNIYDTDVKKYVLAKAHERNENQLGYQRSMSDFNSAMDRDADLDFNKVATYPIIRDDPWEDW